MLQETFGGALVGKAAIGFADLRQDAALLAGAVAVGAGFVGLISLFNIGGRIFWASSSDKLGRKPTYVVFFVLGIALYLLAAYAASVKSMALFVTSLCVLASMYGGGFATIPAYLADLFGTQFVGAIHGRLLTAWSTAGILGPLIVNYMHDVRLESGQPFDQLYPPIFQVLAGMLAIGLVADLLVRPVAARHFMSDDELAREKQLAHETPLAAQGEVTAAAAHPTAHIRVILAWVAVGIPLAYGVWVTLLKSAALFR
jgi:MFS family permease